jgi:hypothetical protein
MVRAVAPGDILMSDLRGGVVRIDPETGTVTPVAPLGFSNIFASGVSISSSDIGVFVIASKPTMTIDQSSLTLVDFFPPATSCAEFYEHEPFSYIYGVHLGRLVRIRATGPVPGSAIDAGEGTCPLAIDRAGRRIISRASSSGGLRVSSFETGETQVVSPSLLPIGLAVGNSGEVFVSDEATGAIYRLDPTGPELIGAGAGPLAVLPPSGDIMVAEGHDVIRVDAETGARSPPWLCPNPIDDLTIGSDGDVWA